MNENQDQQQADNDQLSALEKEALLIDQAASNEQQQTAQQPEQQSLNADYLPVIVKALSMAAGFGNSIIPFTSQCFNDNAIRDIAENVIRVADVEKVELKKIFGEPNSRIGAWVALGFSVGAPSFMFWLALQEYKQTKKPASNEKEVKGDIVTTDAPNPDDLKTGFHA